MHEAIEHWIIFAEFLRGKTMRGLAKRYKVAMPEIEAIIRTKYSELANYIPFRRRKVHGVTEIKTK